MPFTVLLFVHRKPDVSPAEFKTHYEDTHIPLLKSIAGESFPLSHTRRYIARSPEAPEYAALALVGTPADFSYDAIVELICKDEAAFQLFFACVSAQEAAEKIAADEERFLDRTKLRAVVIGDVAVTPPERRGH